MAVNRCSGLQPLLSMGSVVMYENKMEELTNQEIIVEENMLKRPKKKKITRRIVVTAVIFLLISLAGILLWNIYGNNSDPLQDALNAELGQLDGKSKEEIEAELNRIVEEGSMHISMNTKPIFKDGKAKGDLKIENSPANHYGQEIIITVNKTGKEIYRSGLLMPNHHIQKDKLKVDLKKGNYDCTATFVAYDTKLEDEPTEIGRLKAEIEIKVLE